MVIWTTKIFFFFFGTVLCFLDISSVSLLRLLSPYHLCPLLCPSLHEIFPRYLQFSWRDICLSHSIVFLYFFHCSLKKAFLSLLPILCNSALGWLYQPLLFSSFPQLFVKPHQIITLPSWITFSLELFRSLPPVQCYEILSTDLQGTLFYQV